MASLAGFALPLMGRLREEGFEVEALGQFDGFEDRVRDAGFPVHPWCAGHTFNPLTIWRARRELSAFLTGSPYDIVHTHCSFAGIIGNPVAFTRVRHLVYTQHGFYVHEGLNPLARQAWLVVEKIGLRWAHHVICVSHAEKQLAETLRVGPPEKFHLLPGIGVDLNRFRATPEERRQRRAAVRESLGIGPDETVLLTVSRLTWDKGYREMIEAANLGAPAPSPAPRFLAAGSGKDEHAIRQAIQDAGLSDRFTLLGWRDDVVDLYSAADVFVFASHREGLPIAPIEAMASGLPVIASDLPGCREEVEHEQSGLLFPVRDAAALADSIRRLLADRDLADRLASGARTRAEAFGLDVALDRQMALYRQLRLPPGA